MRFGRHKFTIPGDSFASFLYRPQILVAVCNSHGDQWIADSILRWQGHLHRLFYPRNPTRRYSKNMTLRISRVDCSLAKGRKRKKSNKWNYPSIIEWDLTNGPLRRLLELLNTQVKGSVQWVLLEISWKLALPDIPTEKKTPPGEPWGMCSSTSKNYCAKRYTACPADHGYYARGGDKRWCNHAKDSLWNEPWENSSWSITCN